MSEIEIYCRFIKISGSGWTPQACKGKEVQTNTPDSDQKIKWLMWSQKLKKRKNYRSEYKTNSYLSEVK